MNTKIPLFTLVFSYLYAIRSGWSKTARICVIVCSVLVLFNTVLEICEVKNNVRK